MFEHVVAAVAVPWVPDSLVQNGGSKAWFPYDRKDCHSDARIAENYDLQSLRQHFLYDVPSPGLPLLPPFSWPLRMAAMKGNQETTRTRNAEWNHLGFGRFSA